MADAVVDASVWVSRLVAGDVHHTVCARWLSEQVASGWFLIAPALLLPEVAGPIARKTRDRRLGRAAVEGILQVRSLRLVELDEALAQAAATLAADLALRGADAVYVALAARLGLSLITLDGQQLVRAAPVVDVRRPG